MEHVVRVGMKVTTMDDDVSEEWDAYYGPVTDYDIRGDTLYGLIPEDIPSTQHLRFDQRQSNLKRGPRDPDTITREAYYRRDDY